MLRVLLLVAVLVAAVRGLAVAPPVRWLAMTVSPRSPFSRPQIAAAAVGAALSVTAGVHLDFGGGAFHLGWAPVVVQADSTGKFSSKMTAKKRYLPRIEAGVAEFNALGKSLTPAAAAAYVEGGDKSPVEKLARAMDLYGLSLRKGEVPDEISRTAEKLTKAFEVEAGKLGKAKDLPAQYKAAADALKKYTDFAKIEAQ